jgi:hypothetical protein
MRSRASLVVFALLTLSAAASADEIVVDQGGTGDFTTIKDAFQAASDGDTIIINPGTYKGDLNRNISWGERNLVMRAGDPGDHALIDLEGQARFLSILSGATDTTSVVSGVRVKNGLARSYSEDGGGAILVQNGSPTIQGCSFRECDGEFGGAVKLLHSEGKVQYCEFIDNTGDYGGALHVAYGGDAVVRSCVFVGNTASIQGGAMRFYSAVRTVRSCTIALSGSPTGAGLALYSGSTPVIERCIIGFSTEGSALHAASLPDTVFHCISYGNEGGNDLPGSRDLNLYIDPLFCYLPFDDVNLCENSPGLPDNNAWSVHIGRYGRGCGPCDSPVAESTWGGIKALYRRP